MHPVAPLSRDMVNPKTVVNNIDLCQDHRAGVKPAPLPGRGGGGPRQRRDRLLRGLHNLRLEFLAGHG